MASYTPDRWVIVETITNGGTKTNKVLASYYGGFAGADEWKLSSGITKTTEFDDRYEFDNYSGSLYICYKQSYGASAYTRSIYAGWKEQVPDQINMVDGYGKL